jgi:hypothetical protein
VKGRPKAITIVTMLKMTTSSTAPRSIRLYRFEYSKAMLPTATMIVQIVSEVPLSAWPPSGTMMLSATATPPTMPPTWRTFESAITTQRRLIQPTSPNLGGTLL